MRLFAVTHGLTLFTSLLALPLGSGAADPEELVGRLTGLPALEIGGAKTFSREEITRALSFTPRFLAVSHPRAPLAAYLRFLEETVSGGYQRGAFPAARVKAAADREGGLVKITVEEGRRLTAGPVLASGNRALSLQALTDPLTLSDDPRGKPPLWLTGRPARLDPGSLRQARTLVEKAYSRAGHLSPRIEVSWREEDGATAGLRLAVLEEGPKSTLGEVRFQGKFSDDPEAIKTALGIRPGLEVTSILLDGCREKLEGMGRYTKVEVKTEPRTPEVADVEIRLFQGSYAPPFGTPPGDAFLALRKALAWYRSPAGRKKDLVLRLSGTKSLPSWPPDLIVEAGLTASGLLLQVRQGQDRPNSGALALVIHEGQGLFVWSALRLFSRFDLRRGPLFTALIQLKAADPEGLKPGEGEMQFVAGFSFTAGKKAAEGRFRLDLQATEAALLCLAGKQELKFSGEGRFLAVDLSLKGEAPLRLGKVDRETGEMELGLAMERNGLKVSLSSEKLDLGSRLESLSAEAVQSRYQQVSTPVFFIRAALAFVGEKASAGEEGEGARDRAFGAVLAGALKEGSDLLTSLSGFFESAFGNPGTESGEEFKTTGWDSAESDSSSRSLGRAVAVFASRAVAVMPRDSWLQTILRETACVASGEAVYTQLELQHLYGSPEVGPLGLLAIAEALKALKMSDLSRKFAGEAAGRANLTGFQKELRLLRTEGSLPWRVLQAMGSAVKGLGEEEITRIRKAAERTGSEADRDFLRFLDRARTRPDALDAGAALLEGFWVCGLGEALRRESEELARSA